MVRINSSSASGAPELNFWKNKLNDSNHFFLFLFQGELPDPEEDYNEKSGIKTQIEYKYDDDGKKVKVHSQHPLLNTSSTISLRFLNQLCYNGEAMMELTKYSVAYQTLIWPDDFNFGYFNWNALDILLSVVMVGKLRNCLAINATKEIQLKLALSLEEIWVTRDRY